MGSEHLGTSLSFIEHFLTHTMSSGRTLFSNNSNGSLRNFIKLGDLYK